MTERYSWRWVLKARYDGFCNVGNCAFKASHGYLSCPKCRKRNREYKAARRLAAKKATR